MPGAPPVYACVRGCQRAAGVSATELTPPDRVEAQKPSPPRPSVPLPGMQNAVINHVFAGMFAGQDSGTFGTLYLDEFSFKR